MPRALAAITIIAVLVLCVWWTSSLSADSAWQVEHKGAESAPSSIAPDTRLIVPETVGARTAGYGEGVAATAGADPGTEASGGSAPGAHPGARNLRYATGLLLHPGGAPFAGRSVHVALTVAGGTPGAAGAPKTSTSWTASDGRFKLVLRGVARADLPYALTIFEDKALATGLSVTAIVPPFGAESTVDLGALRLTSRPQGVLAEFVLNAGIEQHAITLLGSAIGQSRGLALYSHRTGKPIGRATYDRALGKFAFLFSNGETLGWIVLPRPGVRAEDIAARLYLDVRSQGVTAAAVDDEPGLLVLAGENVTVELARGGTIEGRITSPAQLDSSARVVAWRRAGTLGDATARQDPVVEKRGEIYFKTGVGESPLAECRSASADGTFRLVDVPPGVVAVHVEVGGRVVAVVSDIDVRNEEVTRDPRLAGLVLHDASLLTLPAGDSPR